MILMFHSSFFTFKTVIMRYIKTKIKKNMQGKFHKNLHIYNCFIKMHALIPISLPISLQRNSPIPGCSDLQGFELKMLLWHSISSCKWKTYLVGKKKHTYTCPSSCAIVNAELNPFSSLIEQLRRRSHIVPNSAKPRKWNVGYINVKDVIKQQCWLHKLWQLYCRHLSQPNHILVFYKTKYLGLDGS